MQDMKNLVSGISQQPQRLRYPEQLAEQINGFSSESNGLQKRPPTLHIKNLGNILTATTEPLVHLVNRDNQEKYLTLVTGNDILAFDLEGNQKEVQYEEGAKEYLGLGNPRKDIRINTVADYSFFTNTTLPTQMSTEEVKNIWDDQGFLVNIKSGQYGRTYQILIDGVLKGIHTTPDGSHSSHTTHIDTNVIVGGLAASLIANGVSVIERGEAWLYFKPANFTQEMSVSTRDGFNGKAMTAFSRATQRFNDLPNTAPDGFTVEITGEPGEKADNYYVRFNKEKSIWEETVMPGLVNEIDAKTMPHALVREADGLFKFKRIPWEPRKVGNEESNPLPSFITYPIQDVFFHRSRKGFLSGENVILSRSTDIFNFWMSSASSVVDTDPIDLPANQPEKVSTLTYAVPFAEEMMLFSDSAQFVLGSEGALTPLTARVMLTTDYAFSPYVAPVSGGRSIYFTSERHQYASIKELYTMQNVSEGKSANDISAHVPNYIPKGVHQLLSGTTENILMALTEGAPNKMFVYKYYFMEDTRAQSSWSQWDFGVDVKILGGGFVGSILYLLIQRPEGVCLEKLIFTYNTQDFSEEPYRVFLDRKIVTEPLNDAHYNEITETTHILLKDYYSNYKENKALEIVMSDGFHRKLTEEEAATGEIVLEGDWRGTIAVLGQSYPFIAELSEIMVKSSDERGGVRAETEGRLQLRNVWVNYADTGYLEATVEVWGKPPVTYEMTGRDLGINSFVNKIPSTTGTFKFPIHSNSTACKIRIESKSPLPLSLIGAGWEGMIYRRSKRI